MISLIQPSRNNLKYLKWSYNSVRRNAGPEVEICVADDFSNDGTWEWCQELMKADPNFKAIRNEGPTRLGHTILYDKLINEVATKSIVGIWHADMYMTPGTVEKIVEAVKPGTVVSLTRIEPPLHPPGPEKVLMDFKTEPEDFNEEEFLKWYEGYRFTAKGKITEGIFAPWFLLKEDFQKVEGHDPLYAPQSKEDSDIFNRFLLNKYSFIQLWDAAVYHMTCRGSRFNPTLTEVGKNSSEWELQNIRSTKNFIRKWGHFVKHDSLMKPIVPPKYDIAFRVTNCDLQALQGLEPWCSAISSDASYADWLEVEQKNTKFDMLKRVKPWNAALDNEVVVEFDASKLTQQSFNLIQQLSEIIQQSGEVGEFELDIFKIKIRALNTYEQKLITRSDSYYTNQLL
jgi:glycosyltransferase involved in cell wall biosynthesis